MAVKRMEMDSVKLDAGASIKVCTKAAPNNRMYEPGSFEVDVYLQSYY